MNARRTTLRSHARLMATTNKGTEECVILTLPNNPLFRPSSSSTSLCSSFIAVLTLGGRWETMGFGEQRRQFSLR